MRELNIRFQEQYKRLDKLCKDMYNSSEGVTAYIKFMELMPPNDKRAVLNWDSSYKQLKRMRWMRNQLAHEISIDTDFCKPSDIEWIKQFCDSILSGTDPLARAYRMTRPTPNRTQYNYKPTPTRPTTANKVEDKERKSFLNKITSKIKGWFS